MWTGDVIVLKEDHSTPQFQHLWGRTFSQRLWLNLSSGVVKASSKPLWDEWNSVNTNWGLLKEDCLVPLPPLPQPFIRERSKFHNIFSLFLVPPLFLPSQKHDQVELYCTSSKVTSFWVPSPQTPLLRWTLTCNLLFSSKNLQSHDSKQTSEEQKLWSFNRILSEMKWYLRVQYSHPPNISFSSFKIHTAFLEVSHSLEREELVTCHYSGSVLESDQGIHFFLFPWKSSQTRTTFCWGFASTLGWLSEHQLWLPLKLSFWTSLASINPNKLLFPTVSCPLTKCCEHVCSLEEMAAFTPNNSFLPDP